MNGYLYVVEFSTGVVKVGKSKQRGKRISDHSTIAHKMGIAVVRIWESHEVTRVDIRERTLITLCRTKGLPRTNGEFAEYFSNLDFDVAVSVGDAVSASTLEGLSRIEINTLSDCSVSGCGLPATRGDLCRKHASKV